MMVTNSFNHIQQYLTPFYMIYSLIQNMNIMLEIFRFLRSNLSFVITEIIKIAVVIFCFCIGK